MCAPSTQHASSKQQPPTLAVPRGPSAAPACGTSAAPPTKTATATTTTTTSSITTTPSPAAAASTSSTPAATLAASPPGESPQSPPKPSPATGLRPQSLPSTRTTPSPEIRRSLSTKPSRRSVASMKALLPLTLAPSRSSLGSTSSTGEPPGQRLDDYFAELLARDLELATTPPHSRTTTGGTSSLPLHVEDRGRPKTCRTSLSSLYLAASARVQSLGPIEERACSRVAFLDQQAPRLDDAASDLDSRSTGQISEDTAPPSLRQRESVMTAATSLASTSWKPLPKSSPAPCGLHACSWIDADSDCDSSDVEDQDDDVSHCTSRSPSPRPPTLSSSDLDLEPDVPALGKIDLRGHWGYNETPLHCKSHSVSGSSPIPYRRRPSDASVDAPPRPASTAAIHKREQRKSREYGLPRPPFTARRLFSRPGEPPSQPAPRRAGSTGRSLRRVFGRDAVTVPASEDVDGAEAQCILPASGQQLLTQPNNTGHAEARSGRPPLRSVQSWLNGNLPPYQRSLQNEDRTKVVPLPPEAMETLRVSIACFPETMLLSSSLTIETIRTYSRKVRQPSLELLRGPPTRSTSSSSESPDQTPRKSLWRKVVPYKKGWDAPEPKQSRNHSSGGNSANSASSGPVRPAKPWEPLKCVFSYCSDYICDALYAHIVAYNYVSALASRNALPSSATGRGYQGPGVAEPQHEPVPKKAASLLGIVAGDVAAAAGLSRLTRTLSTSASAWAKHESMTGPSAAGHHEHMQADLLRCISRLVATAQLMARNGTADETMIMADVDDTDMFFVRSLCEIVRMAEEAS